MAQFKNSYLSHEHSLEVLNLLYGYDSFLDSLTTIADMGCGSGLDTEWWATLMTRDEPSIPRNYIVYAVDQDISQIEPDILKNENIKTIEGNFEDRIIPRQVDLMWSHDSFQYAQDPYKCLATWKQTLNENGMLILTLPQTTYIRNGRLIVENHSEQKYNHNILSLMYMLAVSGFDCRDAYFYRKRGSPWLYAAVYATGIEPMSPTTSWYDLADRGLLNDSMVNSVNRHGFVKLEDLVVTWLDKDYYLITD